MINYLIEVTICWSAFYLLYWLFFADETFFRTNRLYLLGTLLLGLIIPAISLAPTALHEVDHTLIVYLQEISIQVDHSAEQVAIVPFQWQLIGIWIYCFGVLFSCIKLGLSLFKVLHLKQNGWSVAQSNFILVETMKPHTPFSFFNYLFLSKEKSYTDEEYSQILKHELVHIKGHHSFDILFLELLSIFFWFFPLLFLYKKSIKEVHEYLADGEVLRTEAPKSYGQLLLKQCFPGLQLVNNLNQSQLQKRIKMMTKIKSKNASWLKYFSILPILALTVFIFSCRDSDEDVAPISSAKTATLAEQDNKKKKSATMDTKESLAEIEKSDQNVMTDKEGQKPMTISWSSAESELKEMAKTNSEFTTQRTTSIPEQTSNDKNIVYTMVDEMPQFKGCESLGLSGKAFKKCGEEKMLEFIYQNIKYPEKAIAAGKEGMVVVSFIVEKSGKISDPKILREIGYGTSEEVIRLVNSMPNWLPGKQNNEAVHVKFHLPIRFELQDN